MNILSVGADREILNPESDARSRMLLYSPLMGEMHIHCTAKSQIEEKIADNIWVYSRTSWWKSISLLKKIIKEKNIDIIISPDPFAKAWICMILAWWYKKKFLLSVYGGNIFDTHWKKLSIVNRLYSLIGRIVFNAAHAIQTDGLETLNVLKEKYGEKVFWKPMVPANTDELLGIDREIQNEKNKPNILYIGRLIEQKNIPFLVRVIDALKDKADFTVVGDGPLKSLLPINQIAYFQKQDRKEIIERFKEADVLILTSYFEGYARVIMEAALSGIPIVTTRVSGVHGTIVHNQSGYIIEQGDEAGFILAVEKIISDFKNMKLMGQSARLIAKTHISIDIMLVQQKEVYDYLK